MAGLRPSVLSLLPQGAAAGVVFACWAIFLVVWVVAAFSTKRTVERSGVWWWRILAIAARAEERLMTKHFPEAYPAYRRRVKALVPFVL